ncbi:methionine--tRNA ligase subunit beta [candidate division WWE3 bacterium CG08_land_8_20_14_0_20_40_13]|uniref:Methionine--tRNA ligase n=1 Tax=candidate division WWE3 bacterium CG08_land_8_20_14_0_20_40_13 TaxID=1975084 RepID=A0A2H0XD48_UNCKA|nr:MAG: methionine--tRNA ligase subunit beta [candidate division WWE3 bacterium CG08_land_8_20_14_0_20_40_13]
METIFFEEFNKLDIRIGEIISAEHIEGSKKLLKLTIDLGVERRTIVAGIAEYYKGENLVGKQIPVIVNLTPKMIKGVESQGMILAGDNYGTPVLLHPDKMITNGSIIR